MRWTFRKIQGYVPKSTEIVTCPVFPALPARIICCFLPTGGGGSRRGGMSKVPNLSRLYN